MEGLPMTFLELMRIEELKRRNSDNDDDDDDVVRKRDESSGRGGRTFMSINPSYEPGGGSAYGGHVFAQAVWCAAQTVEEGMVVHNVHGFFTLPGFADRPYVYNVSSLSSGRSYATRYVTVKQPVASSPNRSFVAADCEGELSKVSFACLVSFKKDERVGDEESGTGHQMREDVRERFEEVFNSLKVEGLGRCPAVDAPWYSRQISAHPHPDIFPGLEMRKLTLPSTEPTSWRNLTFYRTIGIIPPDSHNLHACAHLYASDRNSIEIVSNALGWADEVGSIGSLSHSVVFHVQKDVLVMREGEWWVQEAKTMRSGQGRGVHESWTWKVDGGLRERGVDREDDGSEKRDVHIASQWQEGMVRRVKEKEGQRQRVSWEEGIRKKGLLAGEKNILRGEDERLTEKKSKL